MPRTPLTRSGRAAATLLAAGSFCCLLLLAPPAMAQRTAAPPGVKLAAGNEVTCTVRSILALQQPGSVDKRLAFLRKKLAKPPFSAFKSFKLLESKELSIPQATRQKATLPTGKILKLTYKEKLLDGKDHLRLRMHLSITPPKGKKFLPGTLFTIANKGTLLVAGDKHQNGTLVVGITCEAK